MVQLVLREARFVVVDLETTGASAVYDRITEVAAVVVQGGRISHTFVTLVNPGVPIPSFITRLTGIDDRLVARQPAFAQIAPTLREVLADGVFVAHNASFDHAFLKKSFARLGQRFEAEPLCTIRLARRLVPGLRSYRLDLLLRHFGIPNRARHRAQGDAEATAALLLELLRLAEATDVSSVPALLRLQRQPITGRPRRGVDEAIVQTLPDGPGVYLLRDAEGQVLYVGKSRHVRDRVREHLRGGATGQPRLQKRLRSVVDVEAFETGSELEALFLESKLIKRYLPDANVVGRSWRQYPFLKLDLADPFPRIEVTREPQGDGAIFGPLRSVARVSAVAELLQETLGLRRCEGRLQPGMSPCPLLDLRKCLGPCVRPETHDAYRQAAQQALDLLEGRDSSLLDQLSARRDALAEALRFEDAAELRDRIRELERLLGDQRRLEAVADRNLVITAPSVVTGACELFFIRAGRLVDQRRMKLPGKVETLRRALRADFASPDPVGPIPREVVDEMRHLETWLLRERSILHCVPIDPADPEAAAEAVLTAARATVASRPSPVIEGVPRGAGQPLRGTARRTGRTRQHLT